MTAGQASWTVSAATGALALFVLPLSALSERFGRTRMMTYSMVIAVAVGLLVPFAPNVEWLVALRAVQGAAIAGIPASAMAYLAEEVKPKALVAAIGLFVAGNSIGGMSGRLVTGWAAQLWGWRAGLLAVALMALACAVAFLVLLPRARFFRPASLNPRAVGRTVAGHLRDPLLLRLYGIGALFMTVFGAVYTVIGYRLVDEPFSLGQGVVGSIFLIYLVGTVSSAAAGEAGGPHRAARRAVPGRDDHGARAAAVAVRLPGADRARAGPDHRGLLRGARGGLGRGEPDGEDGPGAGLRAVPVGVLPRLQRGRHPGRPGLPRGRPGRPRSASRCWRCSASCRSRCTGRTRRAPSGGCRMSAMGAR